MKKKKPIKYEVGCLYKVLLENTIIALWHPETCVTIYGILSEPHGREIYDCLQKNDIFMYIGEKIQSTRFYFMLHKILIKDKIYYAELEEEDSTQESDHNLFELNDFLSKKVTKL
jgi:hypothetical protein